MSHLTNVVLIAAYMSASAALGHEFWVEPADYTPSVGTAVTAQLKNGQNFVGSNLSYFAPRFARFDLIQGDTALPVTGRAGDLPALTADLPHEGLWQIVQETTPSKLTYKSWDKFQAFADHKDFPDIKARHTARDLPPQGFAESYTRHVKALVGYGHAEGADRATGMATEFVALANPYTKDLGGVFPVRLLYQGAPRAAAQVEIFDRAPDGAVTVTTMRTDADGLAQIPVQPGHTYLLDAVVLRPAAPDSGAVWRTFWAALTFGVPD